MGRIELPSQRYECCALPSKLHRQNMERSIGFEPMRPEWHSRMLPLHQPRMAPRRGVEPLQRASKTRGLPLTDLGSNLARRQGLEPR